MEGASYTSEHRAWPPRAIQCNYVNPRGETLSRTDFPGTEWLTVIVAALGAWFLGRAFDQRGRPRDRRLYVGCVLLFTAAVVWFIGPLEAVVVAAVALGPAVLFARGRAVGGPSAESKAS